MHNVLVNNTIYYNTIHYNMIQYNTILYYTTQYISKQYNTLQYDTIQYNTQCTMEDGQFWIKDWHLRFENRKSQISSCHIRIYYACDLAVSHLHNPMLQLSLFWGHLKQWISRLRAFYNFFKVWGVFHQGVSSIEGCFESKVLICQRFSSLQACLPLHAFLHQWMSS